LQSEQCCGKPTNLFSINHPIPAPRYRTGKGYVLGVNASSQFNSWVGKSEVSGTANEIAQGLDAVAWQRLSAGEGTKGPRLYDWAYLELADLDADEFNPTLDGTWTCGPLIRCNIGNGECAFFTTWCPAGTGIEQLVQVEGQRWVIEDSFETAKNELGLDHNETRSWHGWHHHVSQHCATCPGCPNPRPLVGPGTPPRRHPLGTAPRDFAPKILSC